ncbi:hypothetical protein MMK77_00027625 [Citrobacter freundii]
MGSCAAPSAKGDDKFITTDYLQQCLYIDGKNKAPAPDVANALKLSIPELERALETILARKRRRAYD